MAKLTPLTDPSNFDFDFEFDDVTSSAAAFRFDPHQPRDEDGKWSDGPLGGVGTLIKKTAASTKKVTPAVIYKKHDDGAVVGHSSSGQRMRWDAGSKKYVVEKRQNDKWVAQSSLAKGAAYSELKKPGAWFEPNGNDDDGQSGVSTPTMPDTAPSTPDGPKLSGAYQDEKTGLRTEVDNVETTDSGFTSKGTIRDTDGADAGRFEVTVGTDNEGRKFARIDDIRVQNDAAAGKKRKGQGFGSRWYKQFEDKAREEGVDYIELSDFTDGYWDRFGFEEHWNPGPLGIGKVKRLTPNAQTSDKNTSLTPSSTKIKPSAIYAKHGDGDTVAQSADGATRMRWDAGRKKFIVEKQNGDGWAEESALTKGAAYNDAKNPDKWFESVKTGTENKPSSPSLTPEPDLVDTDTTAEKTPEAPAIPEPEKVTSEETSQDGYPAPTPVPEVDPDWPFSFEPFQEPQMDYGHLVRPNDDAYANDPNHNYELKTLPVNTIIPSQENDYEEWGDGLENDMTGKPLAIKKDGNLYLMDGHHRTAKAGENGSVEAWVLDLDKPKETAKTNTPEIPKQADAPEIESTPTTPYVGPSITDYAGAPKDVTDKVRQAYLADVLHEQRVEDRADELRATNPEKYKGYNSWSASMDDARAELASDAPPDSDLDAALSTLETVLPDYTMRDNIRRRLHLEASVERRFTGFAEKNGLGEMTPELKADLAKRTKDAFAGKKVAVRVTPKTVEHILNDGRFKSQFESGKSKGKNDNDMRASIERLLFGIQDKPWQNAEKRPIYGYVALDGIRPAGIGSAELGDPSTDQLTQYGQVQVVLKDSVRERTTAMFGDSLNNMQEGVPSPIDDPDWKSFMASRGGVTGKGLEGLDRSGDSAEFRAGSYAEAQIHGGISADDIEEVVFPTTPNAVLKKQLEDAGIPYRVMNFKTAADGSDEERATALRIAQQDKALIENAIVEIDAKIAKYPNEPTYKKDRAKYEKQLKTLNDALPLLEGTKTSPAKKVTAAKEKVAKATAPKQAEAPKIESTPEAPKSAGTKLSAAEEQELTSLQADIADLYGQSGYWRMLDAEMTHKSGTGKILTKQDINDSMQADAELKKLRDVATPLVERELELRMKRDGDLFGEVEDANAERWAAKKKPSSVMLPSNDPAKIDKIADSYRVNDKQTTEHNMSLRSDDPAQAALSWRSRMKRMINSQQMTHDAVVYRGAALTPERLMQLRPGSVMIDPGSMSTDESRGSAEFYMNVRLNDLPGTLPTVFEIRAPKGIPVADVDYGEYVFDFDTPMRIISTKRENGVVNVVAELVPPGEAKALYGVAKPAKPKASSVPTVNLNAGKRGSIGAKDAKRVQETNFAKHGIMPNSSPQAIYDKAKSTAYYNDWSIMQVLEAIDVIRPGYKKTVLDWLKTPAGSEYVSKKTPTS